MRSRIVDFCIALNTIPELTQQVALQADSAAGGFALDSVNQTAYPPLQLRPIAIAVETKSENPSDSGTAQLAVWTRAWMNRMVRWSKWRAQAEGVLDQLPRPQPLPVLPLLRVVGHDWKVSWAWVDEPSGELIQMGELNIGNTSELRQAYRVLGAVRRLMDWADHEFRAWVESTLITC